MVAYVVIGENGDEGIPALEGEDGMAVPMIASDRVRLEKLDEIARDMNRAGMRVRRLRFTNRVDEGIVK